MSITKRGIYKNITDSNYTVSINDTVFYFSSLFYKAKFENDIEENRGKTKTVLRQQNMLYLYSESIADLKLYLKIEKRGFKLKYKGGLTTCENYQRSLLENQIMKN